MDSFNWSRQDRETPSDRELLGRHALMLAQNQAEAETRIATAITAWHCFLRHPRQHSIRKPPTGGYQQEPASQLANDILWLGMELAKVPRSWNLEYHVLLINGGPNEKGHEYVKKRNKFHGLTRRCRVTHITPAQACGDCNLGEGKRTEGQPSSVVLQGNVRSGPQKSQFNVGNVGRETNGFGRPLGHGIATRSSDKNLLGWRHRSVALPKWWQRRSGRGMWDLISLGISGQVVTSCSSDSCCSLWSHVVCTLTYWLVNIAKGIWYWISTYVNTDGLDSIRFYWRPSTFSRHFPFWDEPSTVRFEDDLDQDDEHKNLEEAVKRYEKAAGLLSDLALHLFAGWWLQNCADFANFGKMKPNWFTWSSRCCKCWEWPSDPARLSKKHLLLPGLHDSPHSTTPHLLSLPTSELTTSDHYWSGELEQRTRYPWYGPHEPFLLISQ